MTLFEKLSTEGYISNLGLYSQSTIGIPQMSSILPYDIIVHIIDTVGEDKDLLKELALVSHSFHQLCCKRLFATVGIHSPHPNLKSRGVFSKKSFVNLLKSRPDVVKYIRKLTYEVSDYDDDHLLSPILPNFLRTISHLNCLTIDGSWVNWHGMDSSLTSAFFYLMHLPTMNHIDLSYITDFPLSSLTPSVNLLRLDIHCVEPLKKDAVVQSEMMPKIREFRTTRSPLLTTKLIHAKKEDGQPAYTFMDLRQLSICFEDKQNIRYLLQNAMLLEKLHILLNGRTARQTFEGLYDVLSAGAGTLKALDLTLYLSEGYDNAIRIVNLPFRGLCEELEAMAGHNMLESLSLEVNVNRYETADVIGSMIQSVEMVLVKPGWTALRQVSFKVPVACCRLDNTCERLAEELQSLLPDKYLNRLSKLDLISLNFSSYVAACHCSIG